MKVFLLAHKKSHRGSPHNIFTIFKKTKGIPGNERVRRSKVKVKISTLNHPNPNLDWVWLSQVHTHIHTHTSPLLQPQWISALPFPELYQFYKHVYTETRILLLISNGYILGTNHRVLINSLCLNVLKLIRSLVISLICSWYLLAPFYLFDKGWNRFLWLDQIACFCSVKLCQER